MLIRQKAIAAVAIAGVWSILTARAIGAQESSKAPPERPGAADSPEGSSATPVGPPASAPAAAEPGAAAAPGKVAGPAAPGQLQAPPSSPLAGGAPSAPTVGTTTEVQAPSQGTPPEAATPAIPDWMKWMKGVRVGGGVLLWYYQPIHVPGAENDVSVFWARLLIDGKWGAFGLHLEPRFRDTKLRSFFDGPVWLQEAYGSADLGPAELRIGKTYSRLGLFWYTSFYGNVQVYDGLKLDPDYGATLQGDVGKASDPVSLGWWLQYFVVDGSTNVSLPNRDTISYPGARRRNQVIGRLEPRFALGPATLALGASAEYLQADLPSIGPQDVWRAAGDATFTEGALTLRGEYLHQRGRTVTDFPFAGTAATATTAAVAGRSSANNDYYLAGAEYTVGSVTAIYTLSVGSYNDVSAQEWMHVPAVSVAVSPNISFLGELVFWSRSTPQGGSLVDRSFNLTLNAHL
jgi:hypothetical protein